MKKKIANWLRNMASAFERNEHAPTDQLDAEKKSAANLLDEYVSGMPHAQHAIDALAGWNTALPPNIGVVAGNVALYNDPRILWGIEQMGSLEGKRVLELGPLEASHTYMLEQRKPAVLHAIEANRLSFLRCLVVKELLGLHIAKFFLGDFMTWLEERPETYDFIVASGVLYHMEDPVSLLEVMAKRTKSVLIWTHYVSDAAMPKGDPRREVFVGEPEIIERNGMKLRQYRRSYWGAWKDKSFCGGMHDLHRWLEKDDIIAYLKHLGFDDVRITMDEPNHQNGPSFLVFARQTTAPA